MDMKALDVAKIDIMRSLLFSAKCFLLEMQAFEPELRMDLSEWPRVVIDVPKPEPASGQVRGKISTAFQQFKASVVEAFESEPQVLMPAQVEPTQTDMDIPVADSSPDATGLHGGGSGQPASAANARPLKWTTEEDATAVKMYGQGYGVEDIAAKLDRPVEGTRWRLKTGLKDRIKIARGGAYAKPPVAEVETTVPEPAPAVRETPVPESFTLVERTISQRLDILGNDEMFTAAKDLILTERLVRGDSLDVVAAVLQASRQMVKARWLELCGGQLPSPDLQARLLKVLTARRSAEAA